MKVVIAGGTGFIGTALCRRLASVGHEVVVLTRNAHRAPPTASGIRLVEWQPPAIGGWVGELAGADALINLAGESVGRWPWTARRKRLLRESRLVPTRTLVTALGSVPPATRPSVFLSASGTDLYEGKDDTPADESTAPGDSFLARLCLDWEAEATRAESLGVRVVLLRTSAAIGPGSPFVRTVSLPFRLFVGGPIGSGEQWISWADLEEVVGLYEWALESEAVCGPVNVASPEPLPQAAFARALGTVLRRPAWLRTPARLVRVALGEQATLALGSRRVWPGKALALGYSFRHSRIETSLGRAIKRT